jgi:hypothetical protein
MKKFALFLVLAFIVSSVCVGCVKKEDNKNLSAGSTLDFNARNCYDR